MIVLLLFSSADIGGAERSLSRMTFISKGIDYKVATLGGEGSWSEWIREEGHQPIVFGRATSYNSQLNYTPYWRLATYLRNNAVDMIYVCGVRASIVLRFFRFFFPMIKLVHGVRWNPDSNSRLDQVFRLIERFTHQFVDAWITNSIVAKKTLIERCAIPSEQVFMIYNGLYSLPERVMPLNERPMVVLTVANLSPRKGYVEYLLVIQKLVKIIPDIRFVFLGKDTMNGKVQKMIDELNLSTFVSYEGFQKDISKWYKKSRLFVLPSLWNEGAPTSILEAMSYSIPCIAFSIDGIPELIDTEINGVLLKKGDYLNLEEAIIQLITNNAKAVKQGKEGYKKVSTSFKLSDTEKMHRKIFREIMSSKT
jgi:glycosyltransferase involved in cell wall biosynthesis